MGVSDKAWESSVLAAAFLGNKEIHYFQHVGLGRNGIARTDPVLPINDQIRHAVDTILAHSHASLLDGRRHLE